MLDNIFYHFKAFAQSKSLKGKELCVAAGWYLLNACTDGEDRLSEEEKDRFFSMVQAMPEACM